MVISFLRKIIGDIVSYRPGDTTLSDATRWRCRVFIGK